MREREKKRNGERSGDPIYRTVRATEKYNKAHATHYSYGQFVTLILPHLKGEKNDD